MSFLLWVSGLVVSFVQTVAAHKRRQSIIPVALDRWSLLWGALTGGIFLFFLVRHFREEWTLLLGISIGLLFLLTAHLACIVHHQMKEVRRKGNLSEFQGTVHKRLIELTLRRLSRQSLFLQAVAVLVGLSTLFLLPFCAR